VFWMRRAEALCCLSVSLRFPSFCSLKSPLQDESTLVDTSDGQRSRHVEKDSGEQSKPDDEKQSEQDGCQDFFKLGAAFVICKVWEDATGPKETLSATTSSPGKFFELEL